MTADPARPSRSQHLDDAARPLVLVANAGDGTISVFELRDRALRRVGLAEGLTGCSTFVHDPVRDLVHAAVKGDPAGIVTLALDRTEGSLTPLSRLDTPRGGMNYLSLTRGGRALLGASYGGGYGIICPVGTDGAGIATIGEPVSVVEYPNLHSVLASADGRFAYFVSLGADLVAQYSITPDLHLTPLDPPTVAVPGGVGPRHLVINAAGDTVLVLTEFTGELLRFRRDPERGTLTFLDATPAHDTTLGLRRSVFGADPLEIHAVWGADLHWGAGERTVWASERTGSTLVGLRIDEGGALSPAHRFVNTETQPRGFALSPDGDFLVAAGERSTRVSLYAVDEDRLELLQQIETGRGANWVRFV